MQWIASCHFAKMTYEFLAPEAFSPTLKWRGQSRPCWQFWIKWPYETLWKLGIELKHGRISHKITIVIG